MEKENINFEISKELIDSAEQVFEKIGLDISTAIEIFLRYSIQEKKLPFELIPNKDTQEAIMEGVRITRDPTIKGYNSVEELWKSLDK